MATQDNLLYCQSSKIIAKNKLSDLEKDIYGDIPITTLMDTYSDAKSVTSCLLHSLNDQNSIPALELSSPPENNTNSKDIKRGRIGTYSTLDPKYSERICLSKGGSMDSQLSNPSVVKNKFYIDINDAASTLTPSRQSHYEMASLKESVSTAASPCLYRAQHR